MEINVDEDVIIKAQNGVANSINFLLDNYKTLVKILSRQYFLVGGDSEDVFQEGMIGLYKAILSYKPNSNFYHFAYLCIQRQIQSAVKIANRLKFKPLNEALYYFQENAETENNSEIFSLISPELTPDEIMIEKEKIKTLNTKIQNSLTKLEKVVLLNYLQGKSYATISSMIGKPKKSVDNALNRIKNKINNLRNED